MLSEKPRDAERDLLINILDTLDAAVYAFDKERRVLFANKAATSSSGFESPHTGANIGAAEKNHFEYNEYYDEKGNQLDYPKGSAIELALQGKATYDLLLEHRNTKEHRHRWIMISCVPVLDELGNFQYGIMWYRDVSASKSRDNRLAFLLASTHILSLTMDLEVRLKEKARLTVPTLADWCAVDLAYEEGSPRRIALVHRDPKKIELIKKFEKKYPKKPGTESITERVLRTGQAEFTPFVTEEMIAAVPDVTEEQREDIRELKLSSVMALPLCLGSKTLGVLTLAYAESGRIYTEEDFKFMQEFSKQLSVILENASLYEEISRRDLYKDSFLASLSHELRNPLAPIRSNLELLHIKNHDPSIRHELDVISHQFGHITRLLNDLLDSTRFTRGKINLDKQPGELTRILEQVVQSVRPLFEEASLTLHVSYPSRRLSVMVDRTRIEQALSNIMNNAVKFTPKGGSVWVDLSYENMTANIRIKDNGVGITASEIEHVFDPYYQSERMKKNNNGLGIGLLLVHQIINLHGGKITVTSEGEGKGSEFLISLPLSEPSNQTQSNTSLPTPTESNIKNILVIDDNKAAADSLASLLIALGWNATALYSGKMAIDHLSSNQIDMIFLDIGMPEMDGYETVKILREKGHDVPIIAVTGYGLEEDRRKSQEAGFTFHAVKPIGTKELKAILTPDVEAIGTK